MPKRPLREFWYAGQCYADPDPDATPEEVRDILATVEPKLTTATVTLLEETGGTGGTSGPQKFALAEAAPQVPAVAGSAGTGGTQRYELQPSMGKRG